MKALLKIAVSAATVIATLGFTSSAIAAKPTKPSKSSKPSTSNEFFCHAPIFAYKTTAPEGWTLDTQSGKAHNLCIVGYPKGGSWAESKTLVYFSAIPKTKDSEKGLETVIADDLAYHKKSSPGVEVKDGETVSSADKKTVPTKHFFQQAKNGRFEAVGYINEPKAVIMAVMSASSKAEFDKAMPAFKKIVESYKTVPTEASKI